jgi:hypothetical protein
MDYGEDGMDRKLKKAISAICATAAASAMLAGTTATPAAATTTSTDTTTSAPINAYCDVSTNVVNQWATGYAVVLTIRNISNVPVRWSQISVRFPGPIASVQAWNVTYTQTGPQATIVPALTGGLLAPGQSVTIGMINASGLATTPPQREVVCAPA